MVPVETSDRTRLTQVQRRARTRSALLESAARGLSRHGYSNLVLEQVAADAGYTRGALYHLFANKEELAMAVLEWVGETWYEEVGRLLADDADPVGALAATARAHAIYCRRDIARVMMTLRVEFSSQDHPVGRAIKNGLDQLIDACARLVTAGRRNGAIPPGPPPRVLALALVGALEGLVIHVAGKAPFDEELAERMVLGVLGLPTTPSSSRATQAKERT